MSHANKANATQIDDHKCNVSNPKSANEIAPGKIFMKTAQTYMRIRAMIH